MASALTLGESVMKYNPDVDFNILVSDKLDFELEIANKRIKIFEIEKLNLEAIAVQAFMYDVVEFATAIKPFFFNYLLREMGYEKVVYLDPDIWVMDSLDEVFDLLERFNFLLTPHIVDIEVKSSINKEKHILNRGVFNLGFLAVKQSDNVYRFMSWWDSQLKNNCFRDEELFVDQKWVGYLPNYFDDFYVINSKAYNIADWNYHERPITYINSEYFVHNVNKKNEKIKIFHFSGIKQQSPKSFFSVVDTVIDKQQKSVLSRLIKEYQKELAANGYDKYSKMKYQYNFFENGERILLIHRRIFRQYHERGLDFNAPFSCESTGFYNLLKKRRLLSHIKNNNLKNERNNLHQKILFKKDEITKQQKLLYFFMRLLMKVIGIQRYTVFITKLKQNCSIDNQIFLTEGK